MTELKEVKVHIDDVDKAIDLVGNFLNTIQIPAVRAADFAGAFRVLSDLKGVVAQQKAQQPKLEAVDSPLQEATAA